MTVLNTSELDYLQAEERRLARIATLGRDGTPHVVPVGWTYNPVHDTIDIGGQRLTETKKYRDVRRHGRAAIVVDDIASISPWHVRGVEIRGLAEAIAGPEPVIRIHANRVRSWGLEASSR
jgi:pyridoxamine 5'-phosphate oxidase family protein